MQRILPLWQTSTQWWLQERYFGHTFLATGSRLGGWSRDEVLMHWTYTPSTQHKDEIYAFISDRESYHCDRPHDKTSIVDNFLAAEVMNS